MSLNRQRDAFGTSLLALALCLGTLFSSAAFCDDSDIYFTDVSPYGTEGNLSGQISTAKDN